QRTIEVSPRAELRSDGLRQQKLLLEQLLIGDQDFEGRGNAGVVPVAGQIRLVLEHGHGALPLHAYGREPLNRYERVRAFAVGVERRFLVFGARAVELRLRRLEGAAIAPGVVDRLQQARADLPYSAGAAQEVQQVAADASEQASQAHRREKQRARRSDV